MAKRTLADDGQKRKAQATGKLTAPAENFEGIKDIITPEQAAILGMILIHVKSHFTDLVSAAVKVLYDDVAADQMKIRNLACIITATAHDLDEYIDGRMTVFADIMCNVIEELSGIEGGAK
jgi:hypothetical protein